MKCSVANNGRVFRQMRARATALACGAKKFAFGFWRDENLYVFINVLLMSFGTFALPRPSAEERRAAATKMLMCAWASGSRSIGAGTNSWQRRSKFAASFEPFRAFHAFFIVCACLRLCSKSCLAKILEWNNKFPKQH